MTHLWIRAEQRDREERVGLWPDSIPQLLEAGIQVTVEESGQRAVPIIDYKDKGATIAPQGSWVDAPGDAIIFGLKELPDDDTPLRHRHIMFGHAYKGQFSGRRLLDRFKAGGGTLYDLEYLVDDSGRRVAAFGYWAGYAGAAVSLMAWIAQQRGETCPAVTSYPASSQLIKDLQTRLVQTTTARPNALVIGALGRVGAGAADLCTVMGVPVTKWDMAETAHGGPFPEVLRHDMFLNCILARPGTPVFVPKDALTGPRRLTVVGDIACDPDSTYNPVPIYDAATDYAAPVVRVHDDPVMDVMAIDNLPSMLPYESSYDFAKQLLPSLMTIGDLNARVWARAHATFKEHV